MSGFLILLSMFLVLASTGPLMVLKYHGFVSQRYRLPGIWELVLQMLGRSDEASSVEVVIKRFRRLMLAMCIRTLKGTQRICRVHVLSLAPQDFDMIIDTIGLRAFCQDYADAYAAFALKNGWDGDLSEALEIYVIADLTCMPNHPRITSARPASNHQPHLAIPLLPESFSSGEPARVSETPVAPVTVGPAGTLPYGPDMGGPAATLPSGPDMSGPIGTLPYGPDMTGPMGSGGSAAKYLPPEHAATDLSPDVNADAWMRDVPQGPALLKEGRVAAYLGLGPIRIGRGSDCDVFLQDVTVSRSHATLAKRHGSWALVPEEGKRCYINGAFAAAVTRLAGGDVLSFASSPERFEFRE